MRLVGTQMRIAGILQRHRHQEHRHAAGMGGDERIHVAGHHLTGGALIVEVFDDHALGIHRAEPRVFRDLIDNPAIVEGNGRALWLRCHGGLPALDAVSGFHRAENLHRYDGEHREPGPCGNAAQGARFA
jgi:hypothetical protein